MFLGSLEKERESQVCLGLSRQCARPPLIFAFFFSRSLAAIDKHHMNNIKFNGHQVVQVGCLFVKVRCLLARLLKLDVSCLKFSFFFLGPFFFAPSLAEIDVHHIGGGHIVKVWPVSFLLISQR